MASVAKGRRLRRSADETKARFLRATEQIFCKSGYGGTTIRTVATRAGVNLGTLQHYWGSKRALFRDLFEQRFAALSAEHLRRLQEIEAGTAQGALPDLREVLKTLVDLTFDGNYAQAPAGANSISPTSARALRTLYGRALIDPSPVVVADMNRIFDKPVVLFLELMRRACPDLSLSELDWRLNCVTGAHLFAFLHTERMGRFLGKAAQVPDAAAAEWVLDFLVQGMIAPPRRPKAKPRQPL